MKKTAIIGIYLAGLLCASCTDDLISNSTSDAADDADGIAFGVSVVEQADMIYDYGRTRAAAGEPALDSATIVANTFGAHAMEGDNPWGMNIHRMPLPFVGIHPGSASTDEEQLATRAPLSEIAGNDLLFHDSLTIWGCVYDPATDYHRFLFNQTLLKKVSGWRSSVHWPYDEGKGKYMRFCAISPAFESMDITLVSPPEYQAGGTLVPPTFRYNVPENPGEQRDVLFGCAGADPASTQKEQHLGQDDKVINITFQHILTAVRFAQGKMPEGVTIKRITLAHIKSQGVYDPGQVKWGDKTGNPLTWSDDLPEVYSTYTIYPNKSITNYEENVYIDGDSVLFLMPQTLVEGAELQIVLTEASAPAVERTLKCSLKDDVWKMGYTVTYKVTIGELKGEYYLVVDKVKNEDGLVNAPVNNNTGTEYKYTQTASSEHVQGGVTADDIDRNHAYFMIHSYRNSLDYSNMVPTLMQPTNKHYSVNWKLKGFCDTYSSNSEDYKLSSAPLWLLSLTGWGGRNSTTASEQTGGDDIKMTYTLSAQTGTSYNHASILNGNTHTNSNLDLSTHYQNGANANGIERNRTTANCYIVNATGNYMFPMIYGNAVEDGIRKEWTDGTETDKLNPGNIFLDHMGRPIKHANIWSQVKDNDDEDLGTDVKGNETYDKFSTTQYSDAGEEYKVIKYTHTGYRVTGLKSEIVWQDKNEIFSTSETGTYLIGLGTGEEQYGYVVFAVGNSPQPANCVIALKCTRYNISRIKLMKSDDTEVATNEVVESTGQDDILWTWHIWLTDEVYSNNGNDDAYPSYYSGSKIVQLLNADGTSTGCKQMLPVNLGWVPDELTWTIYKPREVWIELEQVGSDNKVHLCIRQEANQAPVTGTSTMYQWGRPTALPMVNYNKASNNERPIYGATGSTSITDDFQEEQVVPASIMAAVIGHPKKLIRNTTNGNFWWPDATAHAYWGETKTLYDPCPPGFQMPASSIFGWMTKDDMENNIGTAFLNTNVSKTLNMWDGELGGNMGGYFYAKKHETLPVPPSDRYLQKFYFPATSYYAKPSESGTQLKNWFAGYKQHGICWTYQYDTRESVLGGVNGLQGRIIDFNTSSSGVKLDDDLVVNLHAIRPVSTTTSP